MLLIHFVEKPKSHHLAIDACCARFLLRLAICRSRFIPSAFLYVSQCNIRHPVSISWTRLTGTLPLPLHGQDENTRADIFVEYSEVV